MDGRSWTTDDGLWLWLFAQSNSENSQNRYMLISDLQKIEL